nr:O-fucosyltransferase 10-like [Tanacetum cinerariifolium]
RRICFILPLLLFLSGVVTFVGPMLYPSPAPGSVYKSHEIFQNLWQDILSDTSSHIKLSDVWRYKMLLKEQKRCVTPTSRQHLGKGTADQYLIIEANGGLNQQRASVCHIKFNLTLSMSNNVGSLI